MQLTVKTYGELENWSRAFADEHLQVFIVTGNPGLQKSTVVRRAVGNTARWIEGTMSAFRLYLELFHHRDAPIVIDDVDSLYSDRNAIRLLKCICQTEPVKTVAWHTSTALLANEGAPREFETWSRVAIIANEWKTLNKNVGAVQDRGILLHFQPTAREVHERVGQWFKDTEVYEFVERHLNLIAEPSMRHYVNALSAKLAGLDWQNALLGTWGLDEREMLVARLRLDERLQTERQRVEEFRKSGCGSRATYFRIAKRLSANGRRKG